VLKAFGAHGSPEPADGGQGTSWIAGSAVLKPEGGAVYNWLAEATTDLEMEHVRLARPIRARDGEWIFEGWSATEWVSGSEPDYSLASTWIEILDAGRTFHRCVAHLRRPPCLDARNDPWAVADRAAWEEQVTPIHREFRDLCVTFRSVLEPLGPSQIVHADLSGNDLFSPHHAPAIIDVSPYWRPVEYAEGVVVADALCWHDADGSLLELAGVSVSAVARALLFRMLTTSEFAKLNEDGTDVAGEAVRYRLAAAAIGL
jgi:uncharacterized protein (TIGR02569 family)